MSLINAQALDAWPKKNRIRLINSLLGGKPVHLVGTQSTSGIPNLAVFNSACHVSSDPALIGMMSRPLTVPRDTYANIEATGVWTLNAITREIVDSAHKAGDKLPPDASEFDYCNLTPAWHEGMTAPFVAESPVSIGLQWEETVPIQCSGTVMIIGRVTHVNMPDEALLEDGSLKAETAGLLSSLGLDAYASVTEVARYTYQSSA